MKRIMMKIGAIGCEWALSYGVGCLFGKLWMATLGKKLTDEKFVEEHTALSVILLIVYLVSLVALAVAWATYPLMWIHDFFMNQIDKACDEKDEFEE